MDLGQCWIGGTFEAFKDAVSDLSGMVEVFKEENHYSFESLNAVSMSLDEEYFARDYWLTIIEKLMTVLGWSH